MAKSQKPPSRGGYKGDLQDLVHEVDHRAANAFQAVAGWLMRASRQSAIQAASDKLALAATQVQAFGTVHRLLMRARQGADIIDGGAMIEAICAHLQCGLLADRTIQLRCASATVPLKAEVGCQIGLLVSELISNAVKHAFVDGRDGVIDVILSLSHEPGVVECSVEDDGVGLLSNDPLDFGMGLTTVQVLARQFGAQCAIDFTSTGTRAVLRFNQAAVLPVGDGIRLARLTPGGPEPCPLCQRLRGEEAIVEAH